MDEPPSDNLIFLLAAAGILVLLSMIFSAAESAFLSANKLRIRFLRERKNSRAERTGRLLEDKERLINTLLVANNIVNIALSAVLTTAAVSIFGSSGVGIATGAATVLLLIFGEITPKIVAGRHPEPIAFAVSRFVWLLEKVLSPLVFVFTCISRLVLGIFGVRIENSKISFTEEEIKTFIDVGQETGVLESSEKRMMRSVFKFNDLDAQGIMVPRRSISAVPDTATYSEIIGLARKTKLSRFPVYSKDIDHIEGVLYLKDLLFKHCTDDNFSVRAVMRSPLFISRTKRMTSIQQMMRENSQSLAIVLDEYSGTYGILTSEDIQREIFGVITSDEPEFDGSARLIDLEEKFHVRFGQSDSETIGGFIAEKLGRIPEQGDSVLIDGFSFAVEEMEKLRVRRISVRAAQAQDAAEAEQ